MAGKQSAGLLLYRGRGDDVEVLLGHMGGPFWAKKDAAAWSLPKGELDPDEPQEKAARREFEEELGLPAPDGEYVELGVVHWEPAPPMATVMKVRNWQELCQIVPQVTVDVAVADEPITQESRRPP